MERADRSGLLGTDPAVVELHDYLAVHVQTEVAMIERYAQLADACDSQAIRYLIDLICEDEERHHRVFAELQRSFTPEEAGREWNRVPGMDPESCPDRVLALTELFLRAEKRDAKELKRLRKRLRRHQGRRALAPFLVELMELDTAKHVRTLRFVRDLMSRQPAVPVTIKEGTL